jgi:23S rRNA (cytidine1920-2'-O)/16S rRNA (cytidine1409-2'-O)-methyltransferase
MSRKLRAKLRALVDELARTYQHIEDPHEAIVRGDVLVDGIPRTNPASLVRHDAAITLRAERALRGEAKLRAALAEFEVDVRGRIALDVGAAAGGFTRVLLAAGAARVYAVDAGHGQLLGSLRQHKRVVALEQTNLADLDTVLVPDRIDLATLDLSYLPLHEAVPQLERVTLARSAVAIALVKPQFELRRATLPTRRTEFEQAVSLAQRGFEESGWAVRRVKESPVPGGGGATEFLLHATRISSCRWRPSN